MASLDTFNVARSLLFSELWLKDPFTRGQAWVDLVGLARWRAGYEFIRGVKIDLLRGQLAGSEISLGFRWKWSRTKVKNFLNLLEKEQQILQCKNNVTNVITITNYDVYQFSADRKEQQTVQQKSSKRAANHTAEVPQKDTSKKDYKFQEGQKGLEGQETIKAPAELSGEDSSPVSMFEKFWEVFPGLRKKAKAMAHASWLKAVKKHPPEAIVEAAADYAASPLGRSKFAQNPASWLNQERWDDARESWQHGDDSSPGKSNPIDPRGNLAARNMFLAGLEADDERHQTQEP